MLPWLDPIRNRILLVNLEPCHVPMTSQVSDVCKSTYAHRSMVLATEVVFAVLGNADRVAR
jgi:hypothetical protein